MSGNAYLLLGTLQIISGIVLAVCLGWVWDEPSWRSRRWGLAATLPMTAALFAFCLART